MVAERSVN